jgi:hypothetical protein
MSEIAGCCWRGIHDQRQADFGRCEECLAMDLEGSEFRRREIARKLRWIQIHQPIAWVSEEMKEGFEACLILAEEDCRE